MEREHERAKDREGRKRVKEMIGKNRKSVYACVNERRRGDADGEMRRQSDGKS